MKTVINFLSPLIVTAVEYEHVKLIGRRYDEMKPGEYKSTMNPTQPVSIEGHWQDPTPDEQEKHDTVHQLQTHLQEMKAQQKKTRKRLVIDTSKRLYTQPTMVCLRNNSFFHMSVFCF